MKASLLNKLKGMLAHINWQLLVFMILVLNVKLPVKIVAVLLITLLNWKTISFKDFFRQRYLFFYFGMIAIGIINLLLQFGTINRAYLVTVSVGLSFLDDVRNHCLPHL